MIIERAFSLERGRIDLETGEFPAAVATNGEASDTHILDIETLQAPATVPMFVNHVPDPVGQLGSFVNPRKAGNTSKKGRAVLRMDGRIDVKQDGVLGDVRRDVVHRIHLGDITSVSAHWEPGEGAKEVARSSLNKGHFAFDATPGGWRGTPMFLTNQSLLENSIVGLGADKGALVGRSRDLSAPEHVREFYRMLTRVDSESDMPHVSKEHIDVDPEVDWEVVERIAESWEDIECDGVRLLVPPAVAARWNTWEEATAEQPASEVPAVDATPLAVQTIREVMREVMDEESPSQNGEDLREVLRKEMGIIS